MNNKLEAYIDYNCPYCFRAYKALKKITPKFKELEIEWVPCEAHPRPDTYGPHSDLCARGYFLCRDTGGDVSAYNDLMYDARFKDRIDIEDADALAGYISGLIDPAKFKEALASGKYLPELKANNNLVWGELKLEAIPSFRAGDGWLCSVPGEMIPESRLEGFLTEHFKSA